MIVLFYICRDVSIVPTTKPPLIDRPLNYDVLVVLTVHTSAKVIGPVLSATNLDEYKLVGLEGESIDAIKVP